ncbi:MAG: hypothetical protein ACI9EB_001667 [Pseudomonas sp.]|jgi:hypothetical protein
MSDLSTFRQQLRNQQHLFSQTLAFIAEHYDYQACAFRNADVDNPAGQNEGSCKTLGLAVLEGFTLEETLLAFGEHYRAVCGHPAGNDHGNIRALLDSGLAGVSFTQPSLQRKV